MAVTYKHTLPARPQVLRSRRRWPRTTARLAPLLPAAALLTIFFFGPIVYSLYVSLTDSALSGEAAAHPRFVGLANFQRLFTDPEVRASVWLTVVFVVGSAVIGQNVLGFTLAYLMRGRARAVRVVLGGLVLSAWVMPELVGALVWRAFLNDGGLDREQDGTLNVLLHAVGLPGQSWLYSSPMLAIILANVWRGTAFSMLVYAAALSQVPADLLESAEIDGAGPWRRLVSVTLPVMSRSVLTNLMLITLQTLSVFTLIFVMTSGGPNMASETLPILIYRHASHSPFLIGYGSAASLLLLAIGGVFSFIYLRLLRPEDR